MWGGNPGENVSKRGNELIFDEMEKECKRWNSWNLCDGASWIEPFLKLLFQLRSTHLTWPLLIWHEYLRCMNYTPRCHVLFGNPLFRYFDFLHTHTRVISWTAVWGFVRSSSALLHPTDDAAEPIRIDGWRWRQTCTHLHPCQVQAWRGCLSTPTSARLQAPNSPAKMEVCCDNCA